MKISLTIQIEIHDNDSNSCHPNCSFLEKFYDECKLFHKRLCGDNQDNWKRCLECLRSEIKL